MPLYDDSDQDPYSVLRPGGQLDPYASLRPSATQDPYASLRTLGPQGSRDLPAEHRLALLQAQMSASRTPGNFFVEGIKNIPHNVEELITGFSKLGGLVARGVTNVPRLGFNALVGDDEDVQEIIDEYRSAASAVPEIIESEWQRIRTTYGSVEGFKEGFRERPLDIIFDIAALADIAAAPVRIAASRASARGAAGVSQLTREGLVQSLDPRRLPKVLKEGEIQAPPRSLEERVTSLLEGADDPAVKVALGEQASEAKRAAFLTTATDKSLQNLTVQQRLAEAKRLEAVLTDQGIPDLLQSATVLDKTADTIRLGNPFRLAYHTIGAFPGIKRFKEIAENSSQASQVRAVVDRWRDDISAKWTSKGKVSLELYHGLDEAGKTRVLHSIQSLADDVDLSPDEQMARAEIVQLGTFARGQLRKASDSPEKIKILDELSDTRIMANAITGEARFRTAKKKVSPIEAKVYKEMRDLDKATDMVRGQKDLAVQIEKITAKREEALAELQDVTKNLELDLGDLRVKTPESLQAISQRIEKLTQELDEASFRMGLIKTAERRLNEGSIGFIPGQKKFVDITFLGDQKGPSDFLAKGADNVDELSDVRTAHLNRKRDIVENPLVVEELYLKYLDNLATFHGMDKLQEHLVGISTRISEQDYVRVLKKMETTGKKVPGFDIVKLSDGTALNVPVGMKRIYEDALKRMPGDTGSRPFFKALDFTRGEFAKNVLAMNPGWLMYNVLSGGMLYTLSGGNPVQLARALKYSGASAIKKGMFSPSGKPRTGVMLSKLAEEYREMVPSSQVIGFTSTQSREFGKIAHISPEIQHFGDVATYKLPWEMAKAMGEGDVARTAEAYAQITQNIADLPIRVSKGRIPNISQLNEMVEETWRSATWLTAAQQRIAARKFAETGHLMWNLNTPEMRASMAKLADELSSDRIFERGAINISPDAKAVMDHTNKFMNDYYRLGPIERKVMRRIIPFYGWMKFTNRLALQLPFDHPIRMSIAAHTSNAINDAKATEENLPDWMKDMVKIKDNPDGTTTFQSGRGANPFIGIILGEEGLKETISGINPVLLVPIQFAAGFDMFRQSPYRVAPERAARQGLVRAFGGRKAFELTANGIDEVTPRPDIPTALARGGLIPFPFFRSFEKWVRGGPHDDIGSMAELAMELGAIATGGPRVMPGAFIDEETGKPFGGEESGAVFLKGFGVNVQDIDVESLKEREVEDRLSALKRITKELEEERENSIRKNLP